jgi:hypothetical protein
MNQILHTILDYLLKVLIATGIQLFILFGPLLLLSFLMNYIAKANESLSYKVLGRTIYLYGFGWLGTSVHELGHALFAVIFRHKINDIVLFSPNAEGGSLGHVNHSYDKKSIYQNIGNFFIGIGPIIFGSLILLLLTYLLYQVNIAKISVAINIESFLHFENFKAMILQLWQSIYHYLQYILLGEQRTWWRITLLCYCLYSIGSSITLSPSDLKSALKGFLYFVVVLILFNLITIWIGNFTQSLFFKISSYFSILYFLLIVSIIVNLIFVVVLLVLNAMKSIFI